MKHYIISKQLITKLSLLFTLLILCSVGAKANDVYYEQCTSLNDIVAGQTYLIVISDGNSHYALRADAKNGSAITMESDKKIKNPDASFIWTTSAGSSSNTFYFSNGKNYIYNDNTTTLTCNSTKKSICYISKLESTNAFKITLNKPTGRYIGWKNENTFYAWGTKFNDQFEKKSDLFEQSGALYIYKKVSGPTLSTSVSSLDFVASEVGNSYNKSINISGANLTSSATITISGKDANMFSATPSVIEATDGTISATDVSVTYNPTSTGTHSAVLTISSSDATPVAVDLKGRVAGNHNITWKVNGSTYSVGSPTTVVADGEKVAQLPTPPSDVEDNKFVGWTTTEITSKQSSAPSVLFTSASDAPIVTSDAVYYAVYASQDGPATWKKLKVSELKDEGVYALITSGGYAFSGIIQEDGKSYYCKTNFSFDKSDIATSAPEDVCEMTLKKSGDGFSMYNAKYGYLYATAKSSGKLAWHDTETSYWSYTNFNWVYNNCGAYLRCYTNTATGYFYTYGRNTGIDLYFAQKISSASYTTTLGATPTYTAKAISLKAETADAHWATFSYSEPTFFPETVAVNAITVAEGTITTNNDVFEHSSAVTIGEATLSGVYVPANTGVLIKSADADATCYVVANKTVAALQESQNMLKPALVGGGVFSAENDYTYYKLAYNHFSSRTGLGFYYGADAGGAFYVKAETAYLAVPTAISEHAKAFVLDGETTAINGISTRNNHAEAVYNLNGQRVASMAKPGLYIVNGKKVVRK